MIRVLGISSRTGGLHILAKMKSKGKYQLHYGETALERKKKFELVDTMEEVILLINKGYHPRMENIDQKKHAPDIMSPTSLVILRRQPDGTWHQENEND